jgi:hypothetical protein
MGDPEGVEIDHKFGNTMDNRRCVLRPANDEEQGRNRGRRSNNTSGYVGVSRHFPRWRADIFTNKRRKYLGSRELAEDSARLYDAAALRYFGEFARLNFPNEREQRLAEIKAARKEVS